MIFPCVQSLPLHLSCMYIYPQYYFMYMYIVHIHEDVPRIRVRLFCVRCSQFVTHRGIISILVFNKAILYKRLTGDLTSFSFIFIIHYLFIYLIFQHAGKKYHNTIISNILGVIKLNALTNHNEIKYINPIKVIIF